MDWSPDGSTIAYSCSDEIWTIHPDGTGATRLLSGTHEYGDPEWSPTGEQLLYIVDDLESRGFLGVVDADGQDEHYIPAWTWGAEWSPDGREIVFSSSRNRRAEIYTALATGGGTPTQLTYGRGRYPGLGAGVLLHRHLRPRRAGGHAGRDFICGGAGDDVISGLGGDDVLLGGAGADTVAAARGTTWLAGERGADRLLGGPGDDTLNGRDGGPGNA